MLKLLGKLWLGNATRLVKAHAKQQKRVQRALLTQLFPVAKKPRAIAKTGGVARNAGKKPELNARPGTGSIARGKASTARQAPISRLPLQSATGKGGSWTRAYFSSRQLTSAGPARRLIYWLYVPHADGGGHARQALPLVVMLHGCEQTAPDFAAGTGMNALASRHGFAVLYPQQSTTGHPHRCWPWYKRSVQEGGDEVALIAGAIEKLISRSDIDPSRIYVAGLSAGAALAQILALRFPHLIAAIGSHSGPVYGAADSRMSAFGVMQQGSFDAAHVAVQVLGRTPDFPSMPILILQGEQDTVVRPVNAGQLVEQFCVINRIAAAPSAPGNLTVQKAARGTCDAYRRTEYRRDGKTLVGLCEVAHLTHAWSGGDASLRYNSAAGPNASLLLWDFFKRHRRLPPGPDPVSNSRG